MAIDDTDDLESAGTGHVLEDFRSLAASKGIETQAISRHQLYFHEDVPYTSHNSSMCTEADIPKELVPELIRLAVSHLESSCAQGSDPGLCVLCPEDIPDIAGLIAFGRRAKTGLLTKKEAYDTAKDRNIHLSEHGGTGMGVIGALAGAALRVFGFDGRVKGKVKAGEDGETMPASELLLRTGFSRIMAVCGDEIRGDENITLTEGLIKAVRMNWKSTIIVAPAYGGKGYITLTKQQLRVY
ncbi:MAG: hypothetical protein FWG32_08225 [Oscillospiraceae bacterium]|nr:hypothetical protein [Oscillospiraceae bacterium]